MAQHNDLGRWGEEYAARFLEGKGYRIIARDWMYRHKDIDIIAVDGKELVFVEVRTRRNDVFLRPEHTIDMRKVKNITLAANHYVKTNRIDMDIRFDIVSIVGTADDNCSVEHIEGAFLPYYFR